MYTLEETRHYLCITCITFRKGNALVLKTPQPTTRHPHQHLGHSPHGTVRWAIEDSISQFPFLQMTYTAENPHADGSAEPGAHPQYQLPRHSDVHDTSSTHYNWMAARQMSCRQQTAPPQLHCSKDVTAHPHLPGPLLLWGPAMPGPLLQLAATIWPELIQVPIVEQNYDSICVRSRLCVRLPLCILLVHTQVSR